MIVARRAEQKPRMRGPHLRAFMRQADGLIMEAALTRADEEGLVMASNRRITQALGEKGGWKPIRNAFALWTGTMVAYEEPDKNLGETIEYTDEKTGNIYVFPVPEEHRGKKNIALIAVHPDFTLEADRFIFTVRAAAAGVVENFPLSKEGWHALDARYGIPQGERLGGGSGETTGYLHRIRKRVGLAARIHYGWFSEQVDLSINPVACLGVAVESQEPARPEPMDEFRRRINDAIDRWEAVARKNRFASKALDGLGWLEKKVFD